MNGSRKFHSPDGPAFEPGEVWLACSGSGNKVVILSTERYGTDKWDVDVVYRQEDGTTHDKDAWNFQVRYFPAADKDL